MAPSIFTAWTIKLCRTAWSTLGPLCPMDLWRTESDFSLRQRDRIFKVLDRAGIHVAQQLEHLMCNKVIRAELERVSVASTGSLHFETCRCAQTGYVDRPCLTGCLWRGISRRVKQEELLTPPRPPPSCNSPADREVRSDLRAMCAAGRRIRSQKHEGLLLQDYSRKVFISFEVQLTGGNSGTKAMPNRPENTCEQSGQDCQLWRAVSRRSGLSQLDRAVRSTQSNGMPRSSHIFSCGRLGHDLSGPTARGYGHAGDVVVLQLGRFPHRGKATAQEYCTMGPLRTPDIIVGGTYNAQLYQVMYAAPQPPPGCQRPPLRDAKTTDND